MEKLTNLNKFSWDWILKGVGAGVGLKEMDQKSSVLQ